MKDLAQQYGVYQSAISYLFKRQVGKTLRAYTKMLTIALNKSEYRAWQREEKTMYPVLGLDWFDQKVLIAASGGVTWHPMALFSLMEYSGLRDSKRTPEYPTGQKIYAGDIIQFPINMGGKQTPVEDIVTYVTFDQGNGCFILPDIGPEDPVCLHNDECQVIGNVYENPTWQNQVRFQPVL